MTGVGGGATRLRSVGPRRRGTPSPIVQRSRRWACGAEHTRLLRISRTWLPSSVTVADGRRRWLEWYDGFVALLLDFVFVILRPPVKGLPGVGYRILALFWGLLMSVPLVIGPLLERWLADEFPSPFIFWCALFAWRSFVEAPGLPYRHARRLGVRGDRQRRHPLRLDQRLLWTCIGLELLFLMTPCIWARTGVPDPLKAVCCAISFAGASHLAHLLAVYSLSVNRGRPLLAPRTSRVK